VGDLFVFKDYIVEFNYDLWALGVSVFENSVLDLESDLQW